MSRLRCPAFTAPAVAQRRHPFRTGFAGIIQPVGHRITHIFGTIRPERFQKRQPQLGLLLEQCHMRAPYPPGPGDLGGEPPDVRGTASGPWLQQPNRCGHIGCHGVPGGDPSPFANREVRVISQRPYPLKPLPERQVRHGRHQVGGPTPNRVRTVRGKAVVTANSPLRRQRFSSHPHLADDPLRVPHGGNGPG